MGDADVVVGGAYVRHSQHGQLLPLPKADSSSKAVLCDALGDVDLPHFDAGEGLAWRRSLAAGLRGKSRRVPGLPA